MNIAGVEIGPGQPCRVVAEISNNHNGLMRRAVALVNAAKEAGADLVKFQAYLPEELVALRGDGPAPEPWGEEGWTMRTLYEKAQTPLNWFPKLARHCEEFSIIPWFSSVFGPGSLVLLDAIGCPAYKLASLDYDKRRHRQMVEATGKPILRSCPKDRAPKSDALMLYCPPGYPQTDIHLANLKHGYTGFSYHGTDFLVPVLAVAFGAKLIECHLQLDDEPSELEANVSLTVSQFTAMVQAIRRTEEMVA